MNTYYNMWTPFFELVSDVSNATFVKELTRLRPYLIDNPIQILHPMLFVFERPIINANEFIRDMMRFLDAFYDLHHRRLALPKLVKSIRNRLRRRPMASPGVG